MPQEQILEGNKMIAEFMGYKRCPLLDDKANGEMYHRKDPSKAFMYISKSKYHSSWDWQIPVWEKIGHLMQRYVSKDEVPISAMQEYNRLCDKYESAVFTNNPQKGFQTLLESITWYNAQKQS